MSTTDPYGNTNRLDETSLEVIVARLEARGKHPFFDRMLREYLDAMEIDAAETVLDMGCGTGVAARAIARRPDFTGTVLGISASRWARGASCSRRSPGLNWRYWGLDRDRNMARALELARDAPSRPSIALEC